MVSFRKVLLCQYAERGRRAALPLTRQGFDWIHLDTTPPPNIQRLLDPLTKMISTFNPNSVEFRFLCNSHCGEVASCFGSYKRPIRMSTTVYIKSYRRHSFLVHLEFLEFKDFALSVWVFCALNFSIRWFSAISVSNRKLDTALRGTCLCLNRKLYFLKSKIRRKI